MHSPSGALHSDASAERIPGDAAADGVIPHALPSAALNSRDSSSEAYLVAASSTQEPSRGAESEPVALGGSDLGRLDAAGNTAFPAGSLTISDDEWLPTFLRR